MHKSIRMLERIKKHIPFETDIKISRKGVPHLLFSAPDGITYSICYFSGKRRFKVFYPYLDFTQQTRVICKMWYDVLKFFGFISKNFGNKCQY